MHINLTKVLAVSPERSSVRPLSAASTMELTTWLIDHRHGYQVSNIDILVTVLAPNATKEDRVGLVFLAVAVVVGAVIYVLPSFLGRKKRNAVAISILNLFLGWTVVGWVGALVWALCADRHNGPPKTSKLVVCPICGHGISPNAKACPQCGQPFAEVTPAVKTL